MKILGYSERGLINALLYEIGYREPEKARDLVKKLFVLVKWPLAVPPAGMFSACETVMVEQSFSDFGDADGLFLFASGADGATVFFEGKRGKDYALERAWKKFIGSFRFKARFKGLTSNLFCQAYFKQRLAQALRAGSGEDIEEGLTIEAPFDLIYKKRKIGDNLVVRASVEMVRKHLGNVFYLLMVPEPWTDDLKAWWCREVAATTHVPMGWDISRWGIITIPEIVQFCRDNGLVQTRAVIKHNEGQLYVEPAAPGSSDLAAWLNSNGKRGTAVVYAPKTNPESCLHFSWDGDGCAFRDYSLAPSPRLPKPIRMKTADALLLIQKLDKNSARKLGIEKVVEWRAIIEWQNAKWKIGGTPLG